jgi:hypothetical protein
LKPIIRELLTAWGGLIVLFLVLTHFTGFEHDVAAIGKVGVQGTKALQGR